MSNQAVAAADRDAILAGIEEIEHSGHIGPVIVFGPDAFAVAVGKYQDAMVPFIGASRLGAGRAVIAGHDGYLVPEASCPNARKLIVNAVQWASGRDTRPKVALHHANALEEILKGEGFEVKRVHTADLATLDPAELQVLCVGNTNRLEGHETVVSKYIANGGGFVGGNTAWASYDRDSVKDSHPGNKVVWGAGLGWTSDGGVKPASGSTFSTARELYEGTNALDAWRSLRDAFQTGVALSHEKELQARTIFMNASDFVSKDDTLLLEPVRKELAATRDDLPVPGPTCPVKDPKVKPLVYCCDRFCDINPACTNFPGICKAEIEAEAVTVELTVGANGAWHSTGLYAPAGQEVTIEVEDSAAESHQFSAQIGSHRDNLITKDEWHRFPVVTIRSGVKKGPRCTLTVKSTFGGLIYVCTNSDGPRRSVTAKITGGALAPFYVLGKTSTEEWKTIREQRCPLVPWGELVGSEMIMTMPSDKLATVEDPETLMRHWDDVMDNFAEICSISKDRPKAFRMCADVQLSAGWMHSGYPFMIYLEAVDVALDVARLRTHDAWGYYHEIGHNHQQSVWTWEGLTEVSNNVLCVHTLNTMFGLSWEEARPENLKPEDVKKMVTKYVAGGRNVKELKSDPFLYLTKYMQLQKKYGWDAFRKMFKFYEELPKEKKPDDTPGRIDLWIETFSKTVGENLVEFYKSWGFTPGAQVEQALGGLPVADLKIDQLL